MPPAIPLKFNQEFRVAAARFGLLQRIGATGWIGRGELDAALLPNQRARNNRGADGKRWDAAPEKIAADRAGDASVHSMCYPPAAQLAQDGCSAGHGKFFCPTPVHPDAEALAGCKWYIHQLQFKPVSGLMILKHQRIVCFGSRHAPF